jgi:hypothetical protein
VYDHGCKSYQCKDGEDDERKRARVKSGRENKVWAVMDRVNRASSVTLALSQENEGSDINSCVPCRAASLRF